jgi:hypothetical protein
MQRSIFIFLIASYLTGCSLVPNKPEQVTALQKLAVWQSRSERQAPLVPSDCKKAYESAQDEVQAFISTTLDTEITQKQGELFSQVDLSENRIPSSATQAVKRFLSCGSSAEMLSPEGIEDEIFRG